jgi:hypothetical protein
MLDTIGAASGRLERIAQAADLSCTNVPDLTRYLGRFWPGFQFTAFPGRTIWPRCNIRFWRRSGLPAGGNVFMEAQGFDCDRDGGRHAWTHLPTVLPRQHLLADGGVPTC